MFRSMSKTASAAGSLALAVTVAITGVTITSAPAEARNERVWRHHDRSGHDWRRYPREDRRYYRHHRSYRHGSNGAWVGAGIAGLAAGALIGGALAPQPYAYAPPRVVYAPGVHRPWSRSWLAYCESRYRSFDPRHRHLPRLRRPPARLPLTPRRHRELQAASRRPSSGVAVAASCLAGSASRRQMSR